LYKHTTYASEMERQFPYAPTAYFADGI
jgi:hypothetical protein